VSGSHLGRVTQLAACLRRTYSRPASILHTASVFVLVGLVLAPPLGATEDGRLLERLNKIRSRDHAKVIEAREKRTPFHFAIELAAARNDLPTSLLWAVVRVESNFDPEAVSPVGAQGLGQLMPATARSLGVNDPFDPRQNLDAAAAYLASLIERFKSTRLALAAYNAGPTRAKSMLEDPDSQAYKYVEKVLSYEREFRARENL